jgi:hypothetical protein
MLLEISTSDIKGENKAAGMRRLGDTDADLGGDSKLASVMRWGLLLLAAVEEDEMDFTSEDGEVISCDAAQPGRSIVPLGAYVLQASVEA